MQFQSSPVQIYSIYSSEWSMPDRKESGAVRTGVSYKARMIEPSATVQPTFSITKECWDKLQLSNDAKRETFENIPVIISCELLIQSFDGRNTQKLVIVDIHHVEKK